jgi:hypothetical protein
VAANYVGALGALARASSQDATQRRLLARGDGLPAATLALHCLCSAMAGRWSCGGPAEMEPFALASFAGDCRCVAEVPMPEGCGEWHEDDLVEGSTLVCRVVRNCVPEIDHDNPRIRQASTQGMQLLLWLVSSVCRHGTDSQKTLYIDFYIVNALGH